MSKDGFKEVKVRLVLEEGTLSQDGVPIRTPEDALNYLSQEMKDLNQEQVVIVNLDNTLKPINFNVLSQGGLANCQVPMEQVFQSTILSNSSHILLLHNHPSGSLEPSKLDIEVTERLAKAGQIVGIPLVDHVIVAGQTGEYRSIRMERPDLFVENANITEVADPNREKMKEVMQKLEDGVRDVFTSARFKGHLMTVSQFYRYSLNNQLLIFLQRPDASYVAGYRAWSDKFGRHVRQGEKGIAIISPIVRKQKKETSWVDENGVMQTGEQEVLVTNFRVNYVFDISQTEGKELNLLTPKELTGKVAMYDDMVKIFQDGSPVPIRFDDISGEAKGFYSNVDKEIVIQKGMSEEQTIKTMVHELAHAHLHDRDDMTENGIQKDRQTMETEAESIAFVTCNVLGIDASDFSFDYIAGWSAGKEMKVLKDSLSTIRNTAGAMISDIEGKLNTIDRYEIYQISETGALADLKFFGMDELEGMDLKVTDYDRVYLDRYNGESLDDIFARFNLNHPEDFTGHSLSVSDVIVLHQAGKDTAFFVDRFGFREIPDFKNTERKEQKYDRETEKTHEKQKVR